MYKYGIDYGVPYSSMGGGLPTAISPPSFDPLSFNPKFWALPTDETTINSLLAADFVSANTEYLSSASTDFDKSNEDFSYGFWFKKDGNIAQALGGKWDATGNQRSYLINTNASMEIVCNISGDGISQTQINLGLYSSVTWYFVCVVYDSVNDLWKGSLNGANFVTASHSTGAYLSTAELTLGTYNAGANLYDGQIDAPFFYDKALTQSEVNALYNSGSGVMYADLTTDQKTSLVSWWQLNEPSGSRGDSHGTNTLTDNNSVLSAQGHIQEEVTQDGDSVYTVIDKSGTNNNALQTTVTNQPTWTNAKELTFDGLTEFLNLDAVLNDVSTDTKGSWAVWVKPTNSLVGAKYFLSFGEATNNDSLIFQNDGGKVNVQCNDGGVSQFNLITDSIELTLNTWTHCVVVFNGTDATIYIDSVAVSQSYTVSTDKTKFFNDLTLIDNARLGSANLTGSESGHFDGSIGEVLTTSAVLSNSDVINLYNSQKLVYV
jgi:hypothetical protein